MSIGTFELASYEHRYTQTRLFPKRLFYYNCSICTLTPAICMWLHLLWCKQLLALAGGDESTPANGIISTDAWFWSHNPLNWPMKGMGVKITVFSQRGQRWYVGADAARLCYVMKFQLSKSMLTGSCATILLRDYGYDMASQRITGSFLDSALRQTTSKVWLYRQQKSY